MSGPALVLALPVEGVEPLDRVVGLPLVLRTVLTLQKQGVARIELVVPTGDSAIAACVTADPRVTAEVMVREAADERAALRETELTPPLLVAPYDTIVDPTLYRALLQPKAGPLLARPPDFGRQAFLATEQLLAELAEHDTLEAGLRAVRAPALDAGWIADARSAEGRREATHQLFEACRKPVDGIVSRHLNRHVSIFVSKRLVDTGISPNAISVFTLALGIVSAVLVSFGGYGWMLAGAGLFQLSSILDGVDGELARVRFQHSKLGEWLDTVSDDVSNVVFYAGVSVAALRMPPPGPTLALSGFGAVAGSLLTMLLYYTELRRLGSGDFYALDTGQAAPRTGWWATFNRGARYVVKKDFFVFSFVVAAACGLLEYLMPIVFIGTLVTTATGIRITARRLVSRA